MEELKESMNMMTMERASLKKQSHIITELFGEIKQLKRQNSEQEQKILYLENRVSDLEQYSQMNDVIISGLKIKPRNFSQAVTGIGAKVGIELEETTEEQVTAFLHGKHIDIDEENIEACHTLSARAQKHFIGGNGPTKEYPDPIPAEGITDMRRIPKKKKLRERANHCNFPPSKNTDPSEGVSKTEVTVSTVGLDSQTEGEYIVVSINQSQMASPSYRAMRLDGMYDSFSDPYSQSETFPPAVQCLSPVPSSGEMKAEFGFESTNYTIEEPKERFIKSEGMEGGIEWNCAGEMIKEETHRLFNIKREEESEEMVKLMMKKNSECGMTTEEKYRMRRLKIEGEDEEVEESEERRIVKIEDVGENMGFGIKKEEVIDEYEETSGTDLNFPTYRCEGKGVESEFSQQEGELSLSSLVTECLLRQPRVLIKQLNMTGFSVTVSPSPCSMANTEDQGVRSPLGPGKFVSCKRKKTRQIERTQTRLPASLENGICIDASHNPLDSSYWSQSKGKTIEASSPVFASSLCSFVHADEVNFLQHVEKVHPAGQRGSLVSVDSDAENPTDCRTYQRPKTPKMYPTSPQPCSGASGGRIQQNLCSLCGKSFKERPLELGSRNCISSGKHLYHCSQSGKKFSMLFQKIIPDIFWTTAFVVFMQECKMASPARFPIILGEIYKSCDDPPYSQSESFPDSIKCLSPAPSGGDVKAEMGDESTDYIAGELKERFIRNEEMEGGVEWDYALGMTKEERDRLLCMKQEEEEHEEMVKGRMYNNTVYGLTTEEKDRLYNLKNENDKEEEESDEEVEEREERQIVKIEWEDDAGDDVRFMTELEKVMDEEEGTSGTDLTFPMYRCEGKGGESEYSQQGGELSSLVTECLLRQPRVSIDRLKLTDASVTVSPSLCSMAITEDQGLRSPSDFGQFMSCKRTKTSQVDKIPIQLSASSKYGISINASCDPPAVSQWDQSTGEFIEASSPVLVCSLCSFVHTDEVNLRQHIQKVHPEDHGGALTSEDSGAENHPKSRTYQHPKARKTIPTSTQSRPGSSGSHKQLYQCSQCGRSFKYKSLLAAHQRIHTGERPYHCSQCGKNFIRFSALWKHQKTHSK
ncbi:hypothetical protein GJAV_G00122230 [Gymnothorax javanicus]|nr:hypothetical protein GJAV_G00122230 [Gymnothorax javanicus]